MASLLEGGQRDEWEQEKKGYSVLSFPAFPMQTTLCGVVLKIFTMRVPIRR